MNDVPPSILIRAATPDDAEGLTRTFLESAAHHARLDPDRYLVPDTDSIVARYRARRQHPADGDGRSVTLVAELSGEIVGFVDARLTHSLDPMHRALTYCQIVEIAVSTRQQHQGVGRRLLEAAEDWGRQHGAELATLEYLVANTGAGEFYQRLGYAVAALTAIKRLS